MKKILEEVGHTALEDSIQVNPPGKQPYKDTQHKSKKDESTLHRGYTLTDLVKTPVEVPHPKVHESKRYTSNPVVKTIVFISIILVALGLLFAFTFSVIFGALLMIIGAIGVVVCVFLPVGVRRKA